MCINMLTHVCTHVSMHRLLRRRQITNNHKQTINIGRPREPEPVDNEEDDEDDEDEDGDGEEWIKRRGKWFKKE